MERQPEYDTAEHAKPVEKYAALEYALRRIQDLLREVEDLKRRNAELVRLLDNALVGAKDEA